MYLQSLAHALPEHQMTQLEVLEMMRAHPALDRIQPRGQRLLQKVLSGDSGIATRHFATSNPVELFDRHPGELNDYFEKAVTDLASAAVSQALEKAGIAAADLDALFLCTCTGYLCPGPTSFIAERLGIREDALLHDVVGLGCGAAIPTLRTASHFLAATPSAKAAVVAVEICSAALFLNADPGALISLCLFGDGASASVWTGSDAPTEWNAHDFRSLHRPEHRESIRFVNSHGFLKNQLAPSVPATAGQAVFDMLGKNPQRFLNGSRLVTHNAGRDVLDAINAHLPDADLTPSRSVLKRYGNMSSPSVMIGLETLLETVPDHVRNIDLAAFGAGFSCHTCELRRES